jgi:hypothetical protein
MSIEHRYATGEAGDILLRDYLYNFMLQTAIIGCGIVNAAIRARHLS